MPLRWRWSWRPGQDPTKAGTKERGRKGLNGGSGLSRWWCPEGILNSPMKTRLMSSWANSEPLYALPLRSGTTGDVASATSLEMGSQMVQLGSSISTSTYGFTWTVPCGQQRYTRHRLGPSSTWTLLCGAASRYAVPTASTQEPPVAAIASAVPMSTISPVLCKRSALFSKTRPCSVMPTGPVEQLDTHWSTSCVASLCSDVSTSKETKSANLPLLSGSLSWAIPSEWAVWSHIRWASLPLYKWRPSIPQLPFFRSATRPVEFTGACAMGTAVAATCVLLRTKKEPPSFTSESLSRATKIFSWLTPQPKVHPYDFI